MQRITCKPLVLFYATPHLHPRRCYKPKLRLTTNDSISLPHRGQGLNNSLEDAARLVAAFETVFKDKSKSLAEAVRDYEVEMVTRGGAEVELTAKQAEVSYDFARFTSGPMFKHGANKPT